MKKYGLLLSALLCTNTFQAHFRLGGGSNFGPVYVGASQDVRLDAATELKIYAAVIGSIVAIKIGSDLIWQATYVKKAQNWYSKFAHEMRSNSAVTIKDVNLGSIFSCDQHDEMIRYGSWIDNAYNSWLCPWNWSSSLKRALYQVRIVTILTLYADLIQLDDQLTGDELVQALRSKFAGVTMYPLVFAYALMLEQLENIKILKKVCSYQVVKQLLTQIKPCLEKFTKLLRQEKDYTDEVLTKRTHDLQQAQINATHNSGY